MEWLQNVQNSGKPKKLLIELLFKRAELLASIKKMKIEEDSFSNINQSKQSEEGAKSTLQEMATSSKTLIHEDVLPENLGFGLRETRIINFEGNIRSRLIDCVTKLLRGNALQMLRNMQKRDESVTCEKFKNQLLATLKPADVQRGLRSELKSQKFDHNGKEKFRSQNELKKNLICFGCKKPGHKISQCKLNNNNNNYKQYQYVYTCDTGNLLYISATIDGITLTMALDSGCTTSILSRKFVERNKITVNESDIRIKTADNNIVKVNGHVCEIEFLVIDHEDSDGLLGLVWFMRTGASLNPSERSLKFPSEVVYLEVSEKEYCNKVITENLTDENCPDDCFSEDLNNFNEDLPLESLTGKIELKPIDNLDANPQIEYSENDKVER
ncbi:hypothetical protein BpHYR1_006520 [Brachionus plicatilis]|uniref:CCHC-type domain-containing protein n=1 Tax=Brachionus plicatilis TaxID=10195 RepID=A0A3M7RSE2_BRAPC|nr:hypothetical protein BpHYR1_006520 [Brachionus plicatilis]